MRASFRATVCLPLLAAVATLSPRLDAADAGADLLPTVGSIERLDPKFDALVPKDAKIEVLASGFEWAEGPVWVRDDKRTKLVRVK